MTSLTFYPARIPLYLRCSHGLHRFYSSKNSMEPVWRSNDLPKPRLNYREIAENVVYKTNNALNRKAPLSQSDIQSVARTYAELKSASAILNAKRNERSVVGERVRRSIVDGDNSAKDSALSEGKQLKEEISQLENGLEQLEHDLLDLALSIPNDTHPLAPLGPASTATILSTHGSEPMASSPKRDHVTVGRQLGLIDLESAATVTGTSWYYLKNEGALLEMALTNYAISIAVKHGFQPVITPDVVKLDIAKRCGFQPRDHGDPPMSQIYHVDPSPTNLSPGLVLSATAEIPLAGMFANKIFPEDSLPLKTVGIGKAFRAEAGARGADTRGLYRVHQFSKVELFAVVTDDTSESMMEEMRSIQVEILDGLGLSFKVLDMPTEELGASAYRKFDIEGWMPGRAKWGELSSLSNCTDYQSRRLLIRYSSPSLPASPTEAIPTHVNLYAHTLNGTAAAIPRLIMALLENGAQFDENDSAVGLVLPCALRPFWLAPSSAEGIIQWDG